MHRNLRPLPHRQSSVHGNTTSDSSSTPSSIPPTPEEAIQGSHLQLLMAEQQEGQDNRIPSPPLGQGVPHIPGYTPVPQMVKPAKLDKFSGIDNDIRAQTWITLFEVHTRSSPDTRVEQLLYNLQGQALEWYGDEVAVMIDPDWITVRDLFISRFGTATSTPLLDAMKRRLKQGEKLKNTTRIKCVFSVELHYQNLR